MGSKNQERGDRGNKFLVGLLNADVSLRLVSRIFWNKLYFLV